MKINKRILMEAVVVSILVFLIPLGVQIIRMQINTWNYVPNIVDRYNKFQHLQQEISIGIAYTNDYSWIRTIVGISFFVGLITCYYRLRIWLNNRIKSNRNSKRRDIEKES